MIVLDTNVVSALMRRQSEPRVAAWLDAQPAESIWTTAITIFEIRFGIAVLVPSQRKRLLETALTRAIEEDFQGRVLPFDAEAAREAALRAAEARAVGRSIEFRDVEIGGIVAARRATLATRNVRHFKDLGIAVIDPWAKPPAKRALRGTVISADRI